MTVGISGQSQRECWHGRRANFMWQMGAGSADQRLCWVAAAGVQKRCRVSESRHRRPGRNKNSQQLTVNDNGRCGAPPFGHDVLRHARVVGRVGQTCLLDDQVVVDGDVEVSVLRRVDNLFIL